MTLKEISKATGVDPEAIVFAVRSDQGRLVLRIIDMYANQLAESYLLVQPSRENLERLVGLYEALKVLSRVIDSIKTLGEASNDGRT